MDAKKPNLMKRYFKGWSVFDIVILCISLVLPLTLGLIFSSTALEITASTSALVVALLFAKAKIEGYILALVSTTTFIIVAFGERLYGEVLTQVLIAIPAMIFGLINWIKNRKKEYGDDATIKIRPTSMKEFCILLLVLAALGAGFYFLLESINTEHLLISTFAVVTSLLGAYLLARISNLGTLGMALNDIVSIILWIAVIVSGNIGAIAMLVLPCVMLVIDLGGIYKWNRMYKKQLMSNTELNATTDVEKNI